MIEYSRGRNIEDKKPQMRSAANFREFVERISKERAPSKKNAPYIAGPFNGDGSRCGEGAAPKSWLAVDLDRIEAERLPDVRLWFARFAGVAWPTHSSTPEAPRERVIIEMDRAATRDECMRIGAALKADLAEEFGAALLVDDSTFRPEQPCYVAPTGVQLARFEGEPLNVDAYLAHCPPEPEHGSGSQAGKATTQELLDQLLAGEQLHESALRLVARWVAAGMDDATIRETMAALAEQAKDRRGGERVAALLGTELDRMIEGARKKKYDAKDKQQDQRPADDKEPATGYTFADAMSRPLASNYFVKGVVGPGEISVAFGESGAMKSFVASDIGLHVASDKQWCGRRTKGAGVLFILGEGAAGYNKRLRAWALEHRIDPATVRAYVYPKPVNLHAGPGELQLAIDEAEAALGCPVRLIVIDTYSTNLGTGDEQSNSDTATVLKHVREAMGPERGVVFVHHVGHADKARERGAYQLRANADIRFMVKRDDANRGEVITLTNEKQKDGPELSPLRLVWKEFSLGADDDGDPVTSVVLTPTDREPVEVLRDAVHIGTKETTALNVLWKLSGRNAGMVRSDVWFQALLKAKTLDATSSEPAQRRSFNRIARALLDGGLMNRDGTGKATSYSPRSTEVEPEGFAT